MHEIGRKCVSFSRMKMSSYHIGLQLKECVASTTSDESDMKRVHRVTKLFIGSGVMENTIHS